jgi:hypothetical protein
MQRKEKNHLSDFLLETKVEELLQHLCLPNKLGAIEQIER